MLHKASKMVGLHLHAMDGEIGHIDDFLIEEGRWDVRYLVVDTSNWIGGRWVLISPMVVTNIDSAHGTVAVSLTRDQIKQSPSIENADIARAEILPAIWIM